MYYKNYIIEKCSPPGRTKIQWAFAHVEYDGPDDYRFGFAESIENVKQQINAINQKP